MFHQNSPHRHKSEGFCVVKAAGKLFAAALGIFVLQMPGALTLAQGQPSLNGVLADPGERAHVLDAARRATVVINNPCASATFDLTDVVVVYRPLTVDATGAITGGAWKQVVREEGCGSIRTLNVLAYVQGPKSLATTPLLPGTTHADPQLQKDGARYAGTAAGLPEKNCGIGYIADTEFLRRDEATPSGGKGPPWTELWTLVSCSGTTQVSMHFVPDNTGTTIGAGPMKLIPHGSK
ncbi:MAG: hypothetical protein P4L90_26395 [Rhodopila sp.]|nr:hypothetical protein [Rhodopila sp.]